MKRSELSRIAVICFATISLIVALIFGARGFLYGFTTLDRNMIQIFGVAGVLLLIIGAVMAVRDLMQSKRNK